LKELVDEKILVYAIWRSAWQLKRRGAWISGELMWVSEWDWRMIWAQLSRVAKAESRVAD
jgi:hypothetical protein